MNEIDFFLSVHRGGEDDDLSRRYESDLEFPACGSNIKLFFNICLSSRQIKARWFSHREISGEYCSLHDVVAQEGKSQPKTVNSENFCHLTRVDALMLFR